MEVLVSENPDPTPAAPAPAPIQTTSEDTRISVILDGSSATPKAVDFYRATPFQMMAIGEWLLLKAKQMITQAEMMEARSTIQTARLDKAPPVDKILRASK